MRKCLARALYMQRKCRVKCVKDVQFKASLEQIYIFNYTAEGQDEQIIETRLRPSRNRPPEENIPKQRVLGRQQTTTLISPPMLPTQRLPKTIANLKLPYD